MIKNTEYLKNIQIICKNQEQVEDCLNYLKQLGFSIEAEETSKYNIVFWGSYNQKFITSEFLKKYLSIEFYNKNFIKILKNFIKEKEEKDKEEEKKKKEDIEVAEDGRITKINKWESEKEIFVACDWEYIENGIKISDMAQIYLDFCLKYGLAYTTPEARDKAMFKLEIETKLKNIAERLNAGRKIDWEDEDQNKFYIFYNYKYKILDWETRYWRKDQRAIYCLDENFLNVAKEEIGEENLIKYFKES